ncbi:MAG: 1-acyl-sn-glycerol-3-phosphate acyltransferase [Clostridia bacterium]|nr:1-acyl-sn-glycerol-3-phosphate acyltransferase [Clostridia bacterium]
MKKQKKNKTYRHPNRLVFALARWISRFLCKFVYHVKVVRNELEGKTGRCVIIANHESIIDVLPAYAVVPSKTHFVVSKAMMKSMPIAPLMEMCGAIGKNQFQTSALDMRRMKAVLDHDEPLMMYPAGLMTESGTSTPIPLATAKVLKWFKADIYVARVNGTYLTNPKWAKVKRRGKITMELYKLASEEEFSALSDDEAAALVSEHLSFDAYRHNEVEKVYYKNGDNVEGLEHVLYKCPNCGGEFTIWVRGKNKLCCEACDYMVKSDNYGRLSLVGDGDPIYKYPSDWHSYIEESVYEFVKEHPNFFYQTHAEIHTINEKKHRYEPVGHGMIGFDFNSFTMEGIIKDKPFTEEISTQAFPILPFRPGAYFEIQHGEQIYRIVPDNPSIVMKWIFTLKATFRLKHENT